MYRSEQCSNPRFGLFPLGVMIFVIAVLGPLCGCSGDPTDENRGAAPTPGAVVLITVDGLSPADLALYGGEIEMPNLARLAEAGTIWSNAWTPCPMSRPAAASYLTGLAPDRSGIRDDLFTSLVADAPTLAGALGAVGYRSGAFPDSSLLGFGSGLLRDFEIVADPPPMPISPARWIPAARPAPEIAADFGAWVETLPESEKFFAWLHFSDPLVQRITLHGRTMPSSSIERKRKADDEPDPELQRQEGIEAFRKSVGELDAAIGHVMAALDVHGQGKSALVIVAGTQGDPSGGESGLPGPGFSIDDRALRVPLISRPPVGSGLGDVNLSAVWAPDVAVTIASLAGAELSPEAEGADLLGKLNEERILFAWSWATLDQLGWKPTRLARGGGLVRVEGLESRTVGEAEGAEATEARLIEALAGRGDPEVPRVDVETIRPVAEKRGITLNPAPEGGREFGTPETRRGVVEFLWNGRAWTYKQSLPKALIAFANAVEIDSEALGALLDRGQLQALMRQKRRRKPLVTAMEHYADNPEVVHWYAHSIWSDSLEDAETLLNAILPYKRNDADVLYDLACARSLAGDLDAAETRLRQAVEAGFRDWSLMENDPDLRGLRESGRFSAVVQEYTR